MGRLRNIVLVNFDVLDSPLSLSLGGDVCLTWVKEKGALSKGICLSALMTLNFCRLVKSYHPPIKKKRK